MTEMSEYTNAGFDQNAPFLGAIMALSLCVTCSGAAGKIELLFHDSALVNDTSFTVEDLAEVTGSEAAPVAGVRKYRAGFSAPPGFCRFMTTEDFVTHQLRPAFPGVLFTIAGPPRIKIRTDFGETGPSDYEAGLRSHLDSVIGWKKGDWELTISNISEKRKCFNGEAIVSFNGPDDPFPRGCMDIGVVVKQASYTFVMPVRCFCKVNTSVAVTRNGISRGEPVTPDNCEIRRLDITRLGPTPILSLAALSGKRASRSLKPGTILHERLLSEIPAIEKGDAVEMVFDRGAITVTVDAVARERGSIGDRIWVENRATHRLIRAVIKNKGVVSPLQGGPSI